MSIKLFFSTIKSNQQWWHQPIFLALYWSNLLNNLGSTAQINGHFWTHLSFFFFFWLRGFQDLSYLTRDLTWALSHESTDFYVLGHQGILWTLIWKWSQVLGPLAQEIFLVVILRVLVEDQVLSLCGSFLCASNKDAHTSYRGFLSITAG